jgi:hypothetical protein
MTPSNMLYMEFRSKYRRRADMLLPWLSEELKDTWAHQMAVLKSSDSHLLGGKQWSRGPTVLK